jgi:hypothetical protein
MGCNTIAAAAARLFEMYRMYTLLAVPSIGPCLEETRGQNKDRHKFMEKPKYLCRFPKTFLYNVQESNMCLTVCRTHVLLLIGQKLYNFSFKMGGGGVF